MSRSNFSRSVSSLVLAWSDAGVEPVQEFDGVLAAQGDLLEQVVGVDGSVFRGFERIEFGVEISRYIGAGNARGKAES